MRKHGLDPDEIPIVGGTYRYASGYQGAKLLLQHKPTAILCFNDEMAFGAREEMCIRDRSYALGLVFHNRLPHIIVKGAFSHFFIAKAGNQTDAV